jgi:hypothetical protein
MLFECGAYAVRAVIAVLLPMTTAAATAVAAAVAPPATRTAAQLTFNSCAAK